MSNMSNMSDKENINLSVTPKDGEVVIRHGEAIPKSFPNSLHIEGTLTAPIRFLSAKDHYDFRTSHVQYYVEDGEIMLVLNEKDNEGLIDVIKGKLKPHNYVSQWPINGSTRFSVQELIAFLKVRKYHFSKSEECIDLIKSLRNFSAKVERVIKDHNDGCGNTDFQLQTKITSMDLKNSFVLEIPLFKGYYAEKFIVEIIPESTSSGVHFCLISDEFEEIQQNRKEEIINTELNNLKHVFPCSMVQIN